MFVPQPPAIEFEFESFRLDVGRRLLLRDGQPVKLTPKVFDILLVLVERRGQVVEMDELMKAVWRDTHVSEGTLRQDVLVLRRALDDTVKPHSYIVTIPGNGYCFVAEVIERKGNGKGDSTGVLQMHGPAEGLKSDQPPGELAVASGISSKLELPFGGHLWHALIACGLYAALYAVGLMAEIAYQFDRYGRAGLLISLATCCWILLTSLAGLAADWKLTLAGSRKGLAASVIVFLLAAGMLFAGACLFLPSEPITQLNWQPYTAQAAYLKDIAYFLILETLFLLPPFHFVVAMQRELQMGRHGAALELLSGHRHGIAPWGAIFPRFWVLALVLAVIVGISVFLHHNLMSNLKPGPYMNLFSNLILVRLILYYVLAGECLAWYYQALNNLKRECLLAERVWVGGRGKGH
jgi:DNA-binding winged helix-turn-helix (wHTH) protein